MNEIIPVYRTPEGAWITNPLVVTDRFVDDAGRVVFGDWKTGADRERAEALAKSCSISLDLLDEAVDRLVTKLLYTFPDCTRKTLESLRKKKLEHWFANAETNRSWLALNMNADASAGFPAFHYGERGEREVDFIRLRQRLAEGARFDDRLVEEVLPPSARAGWKRDREKDR